MSECGLKDLWSISIWGLEFRAFSVPATINHDDHEQAKAFVWLPKYQRIRGTEVTPTPKGRTLELPQDLL